MYQTGPRIESSPTNQAASATPHKPCGVRWQIRPRSPPLVCSLPSPFHLHHWLVSLHIPGEHGKPDVASNQLQNKPKKPAQSNPLDIASFFVTGSISFGMGQLGLDVG